MIVESHNMTECMKLPNSLETIHVACISNKPKTCVRAKEVTVVIISTYILQLRATGCKLIRRCCNVVDKVIETYKCYSLE